MIAMTFLLAVIALGFCAFALFTVLPTLAGMPELLLNFPLAEIIAFRWALVGFCLCFGLLYLMPTFFARTTIRRVVAGITAIVLLGVGAIHGVTIFSRGIYVNQDFSVAPKDAKSDRVWINLLTYNTQGGATTAADIVKVMLDNRVNVAVLPETSTKQGEEIRAALLAAGTEFQLFDTHTSQLDPDFISTILLISQELGAYQQLDLSELTGIAANTQGTSEAMSGESGYVSQIGSFSIVGATPKDAQSKLPKFYGVHPIAPIPSLLGRWNSEITKAYGLCDGEDSFIMAGDFNSTADHQQALGNECRDAVKEASSAGLGTWPASLPVWLGTPIDRVLTNETNYRGTEAKILQVGESDHRGIVIQLRPHELAMAAGM